MYKTLGVSNQKCPFCGKQDIPFERKNNTSRLACKCGFSSRWGFVNITEKLNKTMNYSVERATQMQKIEKQCSDERERQMKLLEDEKDSALKDLESELIKARENCESELKQARTRQELDLKKKRRDFKEERAKVIEKAKEEEFRIIEDAKLEAEKILKDAKEVVKTSKGKLTDKEQSLLEYADKFITANEYAPTIKEFSKYLGKSNGVIGRMVLNIEKKGHIRRSGGWNQHWEFL